MLNTDKFDIKLQHILAYYNILPAAFADLIGVQRSSISHIISGRNKASIEFILKIANSYPEINLEWLLGRKTAFLADADKDNARKKTDLQSETTNDSEDKIINPDSISEIYNDNSAPIEKIVVFYADKTFRVYSPK